MSALQLIDALSEAYDWAVERNLPGEVIARVELYKRAVDGERVKHDPHQPGAQAFAAEINRREAIAITGQSDAQRADRAEYALTATMNHLRTLGLFDRRVDVALHERANWMRAIQTHRPTRLEIVE